MLTSFGIVSGRGEWAQRPPGSLHKASPSAVGARRDLGKALVKSPADLVWSIVALGATSPGDSDAGRRYPRQARQTDELPAHPHDV
jgi:hypothetical protein